MSFQQFAEAHGLIIDHVYLDRWVRCATTDKPHKRNGSYIFDGRQGAVKNWAMHEKAIPYFDDNPTVQLATRLRHTEDKTVERRKKAADKAAWILSSRIKSTHPYLAKKGFESIKGYVWNKLLVLPMRVGDALVGCQLIDPDGNKRFLSGQRTKGASFCFDNKGPIILCEGFATALSIRRVLKEARRRYTLHVCFSASNIVEVAKQFPECFIVADNDPMGIRMAKKTQQPYWVSPVEGEDFNDFEQRVTPEEALESLKSFRR
jgi:putative DNA primase/helicase